jgi:hypothetical protein
MTDHQEQMAIYLADNDPLRDIGDERDWRQLTDAERYDYRMRAHHALMYLRDNVLLVSSPALPMRRTA